MAIENSLAKLINFGERQGYIRYETIGHLDKSCCTKSAVKVIDFDFFKEEFEKKKGLVHFKSADALKIVENRLDFIEMKGLFVLFTNPNVPAVQKTQQSVSSTIENFGVSDKIKDSLLIWDVFLKGKNGLNGKEVREIETDVVFQFILLTDVQHDSVEWIATSFNFFAEYNSNLPAFLQQKLQAQLGEIDASILARIKNLPLLKNCSEIDAFYGAEIS